MTEPTPIALESAANQAYGKALHDVVRAADALRAKRGGPSMCAYMDLVRLFEALDRLTALGWVSGPERVGVALAGSGEALGWQPIATAPKDGTIVIIGTTDAPYGPDMARWGKEWNGTAWLDAGGRPCPAPTHWMPRPGLPAPTGDAA